MNLKDFIDKKSYKEFAGASWPKYEEFILGMLPEDPSITAELDQFVGIMKARVDDLKLGEGFLLAKENQRRQGQQFFNKNVDRAFRCHVPWTTLGINANGEVFICSSPSWIPKYLGSILDVDDIFDLLNNDIAKDIRREIVLGRYYYCNNKICQFFGRMPDTLYQQEPADESDTQPSDTEIPEDQLTVNKIPSNIIFDFDYTCNFKCPSCRSEVINWNKHHLIRPINDRIVENIKRQVIDRIGDEPVSIRWAGGEPFISDVYNNIFEYIIKSGKRNIQNIIQTNGSYLHSPNVKRLLPYISELRISFDAGTSETYGKIRVNGDWNKLISNVEYICKTIQDLELHTVVTADFVVQHDNYREIPEFVDICNRIGIKQINLQKMWNWDTWDLAVFKQKNVYDTAHPEYLELVKVFSSVNIPIQN